MVTTATERAIVVVFAPRDTPSDRLRSVLDQTVARMADITGCREAGRWPG
jgi:DNA/RNA-binding domain of Phe-tRNA-synthetase-like protein